MIPWKPILLMLEVLTSMLLIGIILIQKSKGGGLGGSAFGGGSGDSLLGARAGNVLTKITIGLSIFFLSNTLILAILYAESDRKSLMRESVLDDNAPEPNPPEIPAVPSGDLDGGGDGLEEALPTVVQPVAPTSDAEVPEDALFILDKDADISEAVPRQPADALGVGVSGEIPIVPVETLAVPAEILDVPEDVPKTP